MTCREEEPEIVLTDEQCEEIARLLMLAQEVAR
jgi:hypothetical protein